VKKILLLSDGRPGHYNQTIAAAEAISHIDPTETTLIEVKIKKNRKHLLRYLLNFALARKWLKNHLSNQLIGFFYSGYNATISFDIIISAGKDTSLLNAMLALKYGSKNIFIGNPKKLDNKLFSAILTVLDLGLNNQIVLEVAPTKQSSSNLPAFCRAYNLDPQRTYWVLLIGGNGSGYTYDEQDFRRLANFVNSFDDVDWLVTTSRRTPEACEAMLESTMNTRCFVPYHSKPDKVIPDFLQLGSVIFVTEDSASMISESIASGQPVFSMSPKHSNTDKNHLNILSKFEKSKRIRRISIEEAIDSGINPGGLTSINSTSVDELTEKLKYVFL